MLEAEDDYNLSGATGCGLQPDTEEFNCGMEIQAGRQAIFLISQLHQSWHVAEWPQILQNI